MGNLSLVRWIALSLLLVFSGQPLAAQTSTPFPPQPFLMTKFQGRAVPSLEGRYLNDFGGLLDPITRRKIEDLLQDLEERTEQRITVLTYLPLDHYGWMDSPAAREDFLRVLYGAWGIAGDLKERPGHLLAIGRDPRHVLYLSGEGFRLAWVREIRDLLLDELPNPLEQENFPESLYRMLEGAVYIVEENSGADWLQVFMTGGLAVFVFFVFGFIQKLRAQEPPPPPPKLMANERRVGEPVKAVTVDDLFVSLHPGKKK